MQQYPYVETSGFFQVVTGLKRNESTPNIDIATKIQQLLFSTRRTHPFECIKGQELAATRED